MAEQNPGIYNTVMSYVPGTEAYTKASQQQTEEEHHKYSSTDGSGTETTGITPGNTNSAYGQGTGLTGNQGGESGYNSNVTGNTGMGGGYTPDQGTNTNQGQSQGMGGAYGSGNPQGQGSTFGSGGTFGSGTGEYQGTSGGAYGSNQTSGMGAGFGNNNTSGGNTFGSSGSDGSGNAVGFSSGQYGDGSGQGNQKPNVAYEDDTETHHSGYNPQSSAPASYGMNQGQQDNVRGAPIEGENVKGYSIGAPVGSGDTENPNQPGDPSGQVAGSHLEYGPKDTDTRDASGRGTVNKAQGVGDSSFANVKTSDGQGNSSHVITRQSTSTMKSSSVTQL